MQCPLRESRPSAKAKVFDPPEIPPPVCTQRTITIAPSIGARHFQERPFGSPEWQEAYAKGRNAIEGMNGYVKDLSNRPWPLPPVAGCAASPPRPASWQCCWPRPT